VLLTVATAAVTSALLGRTPTAHLRPTRVLAGELPAALIVTGLVARWRWWERAGWRMPVWRSLWLLWLPLLILLVSTESSHGHALRAGSVAAGAAAVLLVGYTEELWFRGVLLGAILPRSPRAAVLVSAAVFSLVHIANAREYSVRAVIGQMLGAFAIGLAFGAARVRVGSILPLIVLHAAFDLPFVLGFRGAELRPVTAPILRGLLVMTAVSLVYAFVLTRRSRVRAEVAASASPG